MDELVAAVAIMALFTAICVTSCVIEKLCDQVFERWQKKKFARRKQNE